jgi:hypothetical protein
MPIEFPPAAPAAGELLAPVDVDPPVPCAVLEAASCGSQLTPEQGPLPVPLEGPNKSMLLAPPHAARALVSTAIPRAAKRLATLVIERSLVTPIRRYNTTAEIPGQMMEIFKAAAVGSLRTM